jgi:protein SCO1/2
MLTANMVGLQKRLPHSVGLLSFTVDPDHDSPEVLSVYARKFGADPQRWLFVDGDKDSLAHLFRDGFQIAVAENPAAEPGQNVAHTTKFVLIDGEGRIRGYYDGDDAASLDRLAADARRL